MASRGLNPGAPSLVSQFLHDLEAGIGFLLGDSKGVGAFVPGQLLGATAKLITTLRLLIFGSLSFVGEELTLLDHGVEGVLLFLRGIFVFL